MNPAADAPLIATEALTRRYRGGVTALDELSFEVGPGIVGLVGANGAGKSTLIRILLGLLPPTSGRARVLGLDTVTRGGEIRARVGFMPEHDCLPLDVSATELCTHLARLSGLPAAAARERTADTLRHVGLGEERYRAIGGCSTGMRQRVKLAQAIVHDPRLVFLDEPTNGLDPAGRAEMLDLVRRIGTDFGISVLVTSHLLGEVERICDHVVVIDSGRLTWSAPVASLLRPTPVLAVEVEEGRDELAARLRELGIDVRAEGRALLVALRDDSAYDAVRDAAADLGLPLVRMEHRRHRLEELFDTARDAGAEPEAERAVAG